MAVSHGLTAPILNPLNATVKKAFVAARTLLGFDPAAAEFIADYGWTKKVQLQVLLLKKWPRFLLTVMIL